ncbi:MAG: hypothetical protein L6R38_001600 [Xanthoria sp. 2 TBL-2021]|nr:MAG: hypothetical protein L6R38_001600 [Xanthoria sp. 2 TBL-2021]
MFTLVLTSVHCLLLVLVTFTYAVTIEITPAPESPSTLYLIQRCRDIPPGHCCQPRGEPPNPADPADPSPPPAPPSRANRPVFSLPPANHPNKRIVFTGLAPRDIAAAFTGYGDEPGCRGRPKATYNGGGRWRYDVPADEAEFVIEGGHWIRMPLGLPEEADRGWVEAEGVTGLILHSEAWFGANTSPGDRSGLLNAARAALDGMGKGGSGNPFGWKVRRMGKRVVDWGKLTMGKEGTLEKRSIRSPNKGIAICTAPRRSLWPDVILVNGEEYISDAPQGSVYISGNGGKILNYTDTAT